MIKDIYVKKTYGYEQEDPSISRAFGFLLKEEYVARNDSK